MMSTLFAFGLGIGTQNRHGEWLEVYYPKPLFKPDMQKLAALADIVGYKDGNAHVQLNSAQLSALKKLTGSHDELGLYSSFADCARPVCATFLKTDSAPTGVPDGYLKLHLLSHRLTKPNTMDLSGIFKVLPNVAWTNKGAVDPAELGELRLRCRLAGESLEVHAVDKFPYMVNYVVPEGVRIADGARVRLGAYLGAGTTVMQEGFINFNAGCEGPNMVEGRVSSSVFVGKGSDLGGGCSTMGILSGGNNQPISVGSDCLIGANAGLGIPLGDRCTIEAGLYLTAATKVRIVVSGGAKPKVVKAMELAGKADLLFRRNSLDGAVECLPAKGAIELNVALHDHN